jgi:hypothetical protein
MDTSYKQQLGSDRVSWFEPNLTCFLANNAAAIIDGQQEICRAASGRLTATTSFVRSTGYPVSIESKIQSSMPESSVGA